MSSDLTAWWLRAAATVAAAALVTTVSIIALRPFLERYAMARPNMRSSHKTPTPQGGGIAVVAATIVVSYLALHFSSSAANSAPLLSVFAAAILLAGVGAVDDVRSIEVAPRLLLQAMAVALVIFTLPPGLRVMQVMPWWIERILLVIGALWFVNLVNFMDGLDWMMVVEIVPIAAALALLGSFGTLPPQATVAALALCGAMVGFAYFNRPVAKLFLGDVGSLPIGLLVGWLLLLVAAYGHLAAAILLPLYYLADATITLLRRIHRGDALWQAHRLHFYQLATDRGFTVIEVVASVFILNIVLATLAIMTIKLPRFSIAALILGAIFVAALLFVFARGKKRNPLSR